MTNRDYSELREAERRLDALITFCEEGADEAGDLLVEAALLRADLETIWGCVRAANSASQEGAGG